MVQELLSYCPPVLTPEMWRSNTSIFRNLDFPSRSEALDIRNENSALRSLMSFTATLNNGGIEEFVARYQKNPDFLSDKKFMLGFVYGPGYNYLEPEKGVGKFYMDGQISFGLGYRVGNKPLYMAALSMRAMNLLSGYLDYSLDGRQQFESLKIDPSNGNPIIIQIQGPAPRYYEEHHNMYPTAEAYSDVAIEILNQLRWEKLLVNLGADWADYAGFDSIFLLPSGLNHYFNQERQSRFHLRYDVTAKRCGFIKASNGLWRMDLRYKPEEVSIPHPANPTPY